MKLRVLLLTFVIKWCSGVRLSPLENNDKLQDITNLYVAEWQWESWPIKEDSSEQESRSPSQRKNVALWKESSGSGWYLFGGQAVSGDPRKVYSDIWKFSVKTRAWKRLFPSQTDIRAANVNKTGGLIPLRASIYDESSSFYFELASQSVVFCGGLGGKANTTKIKKLKAWSGLRRKTEEDETEDRLTSLAVYAPKTPKSNTVWQIDAKRKFWTAYVCCCDTAKTRSESPRTSSSKSLLNKSKMSDSSETVGRVLDIDHGSNASKNECSDFNSKINKAQEEMESEKEHLKLSNSKNNKKKINQMKKVNDKLYYKKNIRIEKRGSQILEGKSDEKKSEESSTGNGNKIIEEGNSTEKIRFTSRKDRTFKLKMTNDGKNQIGKSDGVGQAKMPSEFCPEFSGSATPVTWCDGRNEALITSDISSSQIILWLFNLTTSHWSRLEVTVPEGVDWPACSNMNSVRYAGRGKEVYVFCSQAKTRKKSSEESGDSSEIPSNENLKEKLVFRINYKERKLYDLGSVRLNSFFDSPEGEKAWRNESQTILEVIENSGNETILVLAYMDIVDLWVLSKDHSGRESFNLVEKIWRGSALKWFDKYNAALYSMQFVSESGKSETILVPNPRKIGANEYWPRERGRFIIRVFRNENLKNQSFENRTREQNLTYELLQSEYKPSGSENQLNHVYSLKVLVFFGISLGIFSIFGVVLFLKRCVNCPPRISVRNECHKSPLVIRYSVIPDDLLYPVA